MTTQELEAAIAAGARLALRPGLNDLLVTHVKIDSVDGDHALTRPARWDPSERLPVSDIVTVGEAVESIGCPVGDRGSTGNVEEAHRLGHAIAAAVGEQPDDGHGRDAVYLTLGQLRRLAAIVAMHREEREP